MNKIDKTSTQNRHIIDFSKLGLKNIKVLGHYNYNKVQSQLPMHLHQDMVEICYLDKGIQNYTVGSEDYRIRGGDVLVTMPGVLHGTREYHEEKGSLYWLILSLPMKEKKMLGLNKPETTLVMEKLLNLPNIHFKGGPELKTYLNKIFDLCQEPHNPIYKLHIRNHLLNFLLSVIQYGEFPSNKRRSTLMAKQCIYINRNIYEAITIDFLAARAGLSVSRFKHRFKNEIGIPPSEYILRQKIRKAQRLLKTTPMVIGEIAYDLNFTSPRYFATAFKRIVGESPSGYRRGD